MRSPRGRSRRAGSRRPPATPRPGRTASGRPARTAHGGSRPAPRPGSVRRSPRRPRTPRRSPPRCRRTSTPLPSYPPAGGLQHARQPEGQHLGHLRHDGVAGAGHPEGAEPLAHDRLVLGVHQRIGPGPDRQRPLQRAQVLGRHVLVVEGDDGAALDDPLQRGQVAVVADLVVGHHLGRAHAVGLGQQPQTDPHRGGRLREHPGQLAATDRPRRQETRGPTGAADLPGLERLATSPDPSR